MWKVNNLVFRNAQAFLRYLEEFKDQPVVVTYTLTASINDPMEQ